MIDRNTKLKDTLKTKPEVPINNNKLGIKNRKIFQVI